jgi:hypothetical protein
MYTLLLVFHSWLRWAAIITGIISFVSALTGDSSNVRGDRSDRFGLAFMATLDMQLLLGLLLYFFLSPNTAAVLKDFGAAMRDPIARFWAVEHVGTMLVAVILAHVGRVLARKAPTPSARRTRLLVCFGIALAAILAGTPWPGMANGRPLFRL